MLLMRQLRVAVGREPCRWLLPCRLLLVSVLAGHLLRIARVRLLLVRLLWLHGDPPVRPGRFLYNASLPLYRVLTIIGGCDPTVTRRSTRSMH